MNIRGKISQDFENHPGSKRVPNLLTLCLAFALAACASASTVRDQPVDAGVGRSFQAPYEQTKEAVLASLTQLRLSPVERDERPEGHSILIGRPPHGFSWGEVGRIFIEKSADKPTVVRVIYGKRMMIQPSSGGFPRQLFTRMDQVLASQGITEPSTEVPSARATTSSPEP